MDSAPARCPSRCLGGWKSCAKTNHKLRAVYCSLCWLCLCRQTRSSDSWQIETAPLKHMVWWLNTLKHTKPPWLDWSCRTPRAASNMQVKRKPSKRPSGGKRKCTSELPLANRKSLFTSIKGLGRPVLISPSRSEVEACKCGDICTAGHCKLPSNCRSTVCSFSLISWWGCRSGFQLGSGETLLRYSLWLMCQVPSSSRVILAPQQSKGSFAKCEK